jgi:hypothetical protein
MDSRASTTPKAPVLPVSRAGCRLTPTHPAERWEFAAVAHHERGAVEQFIREGFESAYGARITACLPTLMALYRNGQLAAACGLNPATTPRLFLEHYLDAPVERVLSEISGRTVARQSIVEVGNLAVARPGYARQLIVHLTAHLRALGSGWVVFSAVPRLRNCFIRLGIPLVALAPAERERLPPGARAAWGTYYDGSPQVMAVAVGAAHQALIARSCTR